MHCALQIGSIYRTSMGGMKNHFYATCNTVRTSPAVNAARSTIIISGDLMYEFEEDDHPVPSTLLSTTSTYTRISHIRLEADSDEEIDTLMRLILHSLETNPHTLGGATVLQLDVVSGWKNRVKHEHVIHFA